MQTSTTLALAANWLLSNIQCYRFFFSSLVHFGIEMAARINIQQKNMLLDLMSTNFVKLFGKFSNETGKCDKVSLWNTVATELNGIGAEKSVEQWKRVSFFF